MKLLYSDPETGMSTILIRMAPGSEVPLHEHTELEQNYMLEERLAPGRQSPHCTPKGALFISFFLKPNCFASNERFFSE